MIKCKICGCEFTPVIDKHFLQLSSVSKETLMMHLIVLLVVAR